MEKHIARAQNNRLDGLDIARFLALIGMVIVNFNIVMTSHTDKVSDFGLATLLQGKAAALFVVLAGIGIGLGAQRNPWHITMRVMSKRALFLLVIGLANTLVFQADILHYYALYFLLSLWFLRAPNWVLWIAIFGLVFDFMLMVIFLDFDKGWDWANYSYTGFWTPTGFVRNLFFNGWHPVVPWLAFLLFGIWLSRLNLKTPKVQWQLLSFGGLVFACVSALSIQLMALSGTLDPELPVLFSTSPVPPMPLYMLAGASFACCVIGACLRLETPLRALKILSILTSTGRQTLTLYIAHIFIGMGILYALGLVKTQTQTAAYIASTVFCVGAMLYTFIWGKFFKRGPLETIMRYLT